MAVEGGVGGWDFFVSYTQADRAWAEWVAWQLEEDGHRVLVQAWDFVPGTNWIQSMQNGVAQAERTIAVLSEAYLESVFGAAEWQAAWVADPSGRQRKLLVVRVGECDRPGMLFGVVGVDLFGEAEAQAKAKLRRMVADAVSGRAKPGQAPGFPPAQRAIPRGARFPGALPRVWHVPARNPNFTGRAANMSSLRQGFGAGRTVTVHSLHGMGGVGKTQLATEFAHAQAGDYDAVWWLAAEEPTLLPEQMARLAVALGVEPRSGEVAAIRDAAHRGLADTAGWLLVFDNAENSDVVRFWLPTAPLSAGIPGHALVTTRREGFDTLGQQMDLDILDLDESVQLLRTRVPAIGEDIAEQIAEELGRLPLALEQVAAYLNRTKIPADEYLDLLKTRIQDVIGRGTVAGRDVTVASLWDLSLERLTDQAPGGVLLLDFCAYLAPVPIPLDLFTAHPDLLPEPLAQATRDPLRFNDVIEAVVDYSLVKRTPEGLVLHRLVQAAIRARHAGDDWPNHEGKGLAVRSDFSVVEAASSPVKMVLELLYVDAPAEVYWVPQDWPRWSVLLPHVLAATAHLLDEPVDGTLPGLQGESAPVRHCSWLLDRAGVYLQARGRYRDAAPLMRRALTITEVAVGRDHRDVAVRLNNLALVLRYLGESEPARPLIERALAITETALGPDHPAVATHLSVLVLIFQDLGDPARARPLAERALAISETALGLDHPDVAVRLNNLARVLRDLGDPTAARPLAERAVIIGEAALGPTHPRVAIRLNTLACVLQDLGDPAAARPLAERALKITETALGPDHPDVANYLSRLAAVLKDLGDPTAARQLAERALRIGESTLGPDHPTVAVRLRDLATMVNEGATEMRLRSTSNQSAEQGDGA